MTSSISLSLRSRRLYTALRWDTERAKVPTPFRLRHIYVSAIIAWTRKQRWEESGKPTMRRRLRALAARRMPPGTLKMWSNKPTFALLGSLPAAQRRKIVNAWK